MGGGDSYDPSETGKLFGKQIDKYLKAPAPVFNKDMYAGMGTTTTGGLADMLAGANPNGYSGNVGAAIGDFGNTAAGGKFGMDDPGYAVLRNKLQNDVLGATNKSFNNSGLFGSDSNQKAAASGLTEALGGLDYANYQNDIARQERAAGMMPGLYEASQQPGKTTLGVGQIQDADAQAALQAEADLFDRTKNADYNRMRQLLGDFTGTQGEGGVAGMKQETPWWQSALGIGLDLLF